MNSIKNKIISCDSLHLDIDLYKQTYPQSVYLKLTGTLDDNLFELLQNQLCLEIHNKLLFNRENSIYLNFEVF
jgi:hypothetical protein